MIVLRKASFNYLYVYTFLALPPHKGFNSQVPWRRPVVIQGHVFAGKLILSCKCGREFLP